MARQPCERVWQGSGNLTDCIVVCDWTYDCKWYKRRRRQRKQDEMKGLHALSIYGGRLYERPLEKILSTKLKHRHVRGVMKMNNNRRRDAFAEGRAGTGGGR